ncbi:hypothetical protein NSQ26_10770 [Bacillus sp. FSL W7-1360]
MFKKGLVSLLAVIAIFMSGTALAANHATETLPIITGPDIICVAIGGDAIQVLEDNFSAVDKDGNDITDEMYVFIDEFETNKPAMYKAILAIEHEYGEFIQRTIDIVVGCTEKAKPLTFERYVAFTSHAADPERDTVNHHHTNLLEEVSAVKEIIQRGGDQHIDLDELGEKLGDVLWHLSHVYRMLGADAHSNPPNFDPISYMFHEDAEKVSILLENDSSDDPNQIPDTYTNRVMYALKWLAQIYDLNMVDIAKKNIERLN